MGSDFVHIIRSRDVRASGTIVSVQPDADQCALIARQLGVLAVANIAANFLVKTEGRDGLRLTGEVGADVSQVCVVTDDPVDSRVEEQVNILFLPPDVVDQMNSVETSGKETTFAAEDDEIEALENDSIDLVRVITEFIAIGLDPYPRAPGVPLSDHIEDDDGEKPPSPFAALKGLTEGTSKN
mgnify:CR=1 FL=1